MTTDSACIDAVPDAGPGPWATPRTGKIPPAAPAPAPEAPRPVPPRLGMFDLVLRGQDHLTEALKDERALPGVVQKLLGLSLLGLGVYGLVVGFAIDVLSPTIEVFGPLHHASLWMPIAFVGAFVGALCICLPSFWFYTQLSGLDASFRLVTGQALRAQATTAVLLLGVLPFYAALVLACAVGVVHDTDRVILGGLAIPFAVGLLGMRALYRGFCDLASHLPVTHRRRGDFLRRMVLCWAAVYIATAPVALVRLVQVFARWS